MLQFKGAGEAQMRHQDIMRCIVKRWEVCQYKISSYSRQFRTRFLCFIAIVRFLFMDNLMPYLLWLHLWSSNKILEQVYFILFAVLSWQFILSSLYLYQCQKQYGNKLFSFFFQICFFSRYFPQSFIISPLNLIII